MASPFFFVYRFACSEQPLGSPFSFGVSSSPRVLFIAIDLNSATWLHFLKTWIPLKRRALFVEVQHFLCANVVQNLIATTIVKGKIGNVTNTSAP